MYFYGLYFVRIVSKGIVELHGGTMSVTSGGVGMGSCFSIVLPLAQDQNIAEDCSLRLSTKETFTRDPKIASKATAESFSFGLFQRLYSIGYHCFECLVSSCYRQSMVSADNVKVSPTEIMSSFKAVPSELSLSVRELRASPVKSIKVEKETRLNSLLVKSLSNASLVNYNSLVNDFDCDDEVNISPSHVISCERKVELTKVIKSPMFSRILIVDDVAMNRKMLKRLLVTRFNACDEAEDGQQAVDMVKEAMASGLNYDIITMDYQMPVMDGVTATSCIRRLGYKGQIIAVTGNALSEDMKSFLTNGANTVLTKPLSIVAFDEYLVTI